MIESTKVVSTKVGISKMEEFKEVVEINLSERLDINSFVMRKYLQTTEKISSNRCFQRAQQRFIRPLASERGDVPGWVLVVLMTTGLVTAIWTIAAPRLTSILKNSLDAMNGIR